MAGRFQLAMVVFITQFEADAVCSQSDAREFMFSRRCAPSLVTSEWTPFLAILSGVANH